MPGPARVRSITVAALTGAGKLEKLNRRRRQRLVVSSCESLFTNHYSLSLGTHSVNFMVKPNGRLVPVG